MDDLIRRLDCWLATNRPEYYAHLQPGVTDSRFDEFEIRFSLKLPKAFRCLYQWRNGRDVFGTESLQHNLMFSPVEDITRTKELMDDMIGHDFDDPHWWRRSWIPFLENGAGDHLCLDLAAENGGIPGQVLMFYHDWKKRPIRHASFDDWLTDLVQSMENGTLEVT